MDYGFQDNQNRKYQRPKILWFLLKKKQKKKTDKLTCMTFLWLIALRNYCHSQETANTWNILGLLIVYWPITIKFRIHKQTSKPQTNYRCCLRFSYHTPYWLISRNTITFDNISSVHGFVSFTVNGSTYFTSIIWKSAKKDCRHHTSPLY